MKEAEAKKLTIKIMRIILEEINGYDPIEIKTKKLAEECETSQEFQRIQIAIQNHR